MVELLGNGVTLKKSTPAVVVSTKAYDLPKYRDGQKISPEYEFTYPCPDILQAGYLSRHHESDGE